MARTAECDIGNESALDIGCAADPMPKKIVIVEDHLPDSKTLQLALSRTDPSIETVVLDDGARAMEFFSNAKELGNVPPCDLVLLDLNLPRVSGFEILEFLKTDPELRKTPVVVLSGSSSQQDIERCYTTGANSYICKPTGIDEVFNMAARLVGYWFEHAKLPGKGGCSCE
jgi:CheY-like chemotaxis protein